MWSPRPKWPTRTSNPIYGQNAIYTDKIRTICYTRYDSHLLSGINCHKTRPTHLRRLRNANAWPMHNAAHAHHRSSAASSGAIVLHSGDEQSLGQGCFYPGRCIMMLVLTSMSWWRCSSCHRLSVSCFYIHLMAFSHYGPHIHCTLCHSTTYYRYELASSPRIHHATTHMAFRVCLAQCGKMAREVGRCV